MGLKEIWMLIVALMPTMGAVIASIYSCIKTTKMYSDIKSKYDLSSINKKLDKQTINNDKLCKEIKELYKLLYKITKGVELGDEDVERIISGNKEE